LVITAIVSAPIVASTSGMQAQAAWHHHRRPVHHVYHRHHYIRRHHR
jgi:hypothetical protein